MKFNQLTSLITGLVLISISITCEVFLFIDFAETRLDKILAGSAAAALVICQFSFVQLMINAWGNNKLFSALIAVVIFVLFSVSVLGSASFFESRYKSDLSNKTKNSTAYKLKIETLNDISKQSDLLIETSITAKKNGNNWYSGEQAKAAQKGIDQKINLINNLKNTQPETNSSGGILAAEIGSNRWALWLIMATLIDLCPLICFAAISIRPPVKPSVSKESKKPKNEKTEKTEKPKTKNTTKIEIENITKNLKLYLEKNNLTQGKFCEKFDIKDKHLSLAKNHFKNIENKKETAPVNALKSIILILREQKNEP